MQGQSFLFESDSSTRTITMGDGGAFNPDTLAVFRDALESVRADDSAGALVITGQGKNFSQGLDLDYLMGAPEGAMEFVGDCIRAVGRLLTLPVPVISVVNGHAFGLGAMITLASDYAVMREDRGFFCLPEIDLGMTLTHRMNALVCGKLSGNALRDVLLTGRRVSGPEAEQMGIVDKAAPLEDLNDTALKLAQPMMGKNRQALAGLKRGTNQHILSVIESDAAEATIGGN